MFCHSCELKTKGNKNKRWREKKEEGKKKKIREKRDSERERRIPPQLQTRGGRRHREARRNQEVTETGYFRR